MAQHVISPMAIIANNQFDRLLELENRGIDVSAIFPVYFVIRFMRYKNVLRNTQIRSQKKISLWWKFVKDRKELHIRFAMQMFRVDPTVDPNLIRDIFKLHTFKNEL